MYDQRDWPLPDMPGVCHKRHRPLKDWPLKRGAKCSPADWHACIRQEEGNAI